LKGGQSTWVAQFLNGSCDNRRRAEDAPRPEMSADRHLTEYCCGKLSANLRLSLVYLPIFWHIAI